MKEQGISVMSSNYWIDSYDPNFKLINPCVERFNAIYVLENQEL